MSEKEIRQSLKNDLSNDFDFLDEVVGFYHPSNKEIRIDLLAKAKSHLVEKGFIKDWFGIEIKYFRNDLDRNRLIKRINGLIWQSITYAQSYFYETRGLYKQLPFVLIFVQPNIKQSFQSIISKKLDIAALGSVGQLILERNSLWKIIFDDSIYAFKCIDKINISRRNIPNNQGGHQYI